MWTPNFKNTNECPIVKIDYNTRLMLNYDSIVEHATDVIKRDKDFKLDEPLKYIFTLEPFIRIVDTISYNFTYIQYSYTPFNSHEITDSLNSYITNAASSAIYGLVHGALIYLNISMENHPVYKICFHDIAKFCHHYKPLVQKYYDYIRLLSKPYYQDIKLYDETTLRRAGNVIAHDEKIYVNIFDDRSILELKYNANSKQWECNTLSKAPFMGYIQFHKEFLSNNV